MFFVNGRPCVLPQVCGQERVITHDARITDKTQIARAFNEVYKTFNVTQSPFIFADIQMDTSTSLSQFRGGCVILT